MDKIMVIGVSAGVGKSTFASQLGKRLGLPVRHLDTYYWKPGWVESEPEEFQRTTETLAAEASWIIDGNYSATFDVRVREADTMIYLELPLYVCLYRVLKRWLMNLGKTRPDMAEECPEKVDYAFLSFIVRTYGARRQKMRKRLQHFEALSVGNRVFMLTNQRQINGFLKTIKSAKEKTDGKIV